MSATLAVHRRKYHPHETRWKCLHPLVFPGARVDGCWFTRISLTCIKIKLQLNELTQLSRIQLLGTFNDTRSGLLKKIFLNPTNWLNHRTNEWMKLKNRNESNNRENERLKWPGGSLPLDFYQANLMKRWDEESSETLTVTSKKKKNEWEKERENIKTHQLRSRRRKLLFSSSPPSPWPLFRRHNRHHYLLWRGNGNNSSDKSALIRMLHFIRVKRNDASNNVNTKDSQEKWHHH